MRRPIEFALRLANGASDQAITQRLAATQLHGDVLEERRAIHPHALRDCFPAPVPDPM
jgi:hypothetical protein